MGDYEIHLFDWDGTLTNTLPIWMKVLEAQSRLYGLDLTREQVHELTGNWNVLSKYGLTEADLEQFGIDAHKAADELLLKAPLFPDAKKVLHKLRADGKKLGIVTSTHRDVIEAALPIHGLQDVFEAIVCGNETYPHFKPEPKPVQMALEILKYTNQPSVMWGDADRDLIAAERAGIKSALFYPPHHAEHMSLEATVKNANPVITIGAWSDLID